MTRHLLVTAGKGPVECRRAVGNVLARMAEEAAADGIDLDVAARAVDGLPASATLAVHGPAADRFCARWTGTILWVAASRDRPNHKRRNWFVGVFPVEGGAAAPPPLSPEDVRFETMRAGGPGGQHVNTTDSAVRAVHLPTGLVVLARDQRSQIRNRKTALERLAALLALDAAARTAARQQEEHRLHAALERGNPRRTFRGADFREA